MLKVNEAIKSNYLLFDADGNPATGKTVTASVYDETDTYFSSLAVSEIGTTGIYQASFTPDTLGEWTIIFDCTDPNATDAMTYFIGMGQEPDILTEVAGLNGDAMRGTDSAALAATALTNIMWTDAKAGYLDNINNIQLANIPNLTSLTREQLAFPDGCVYFDAATGSAGTTFPIGTATSPVSNVANTKTIADNNNLAHIHVHGAFQLGEAWEHYTFTGHLHEVLANMFDLNGQDVDGSNLTNLLVTGAQGGTGNLVLDHCFLYQVTNFNGVASSCNLYGSAMSIKNTGSVDLTDCNAIHSTLTLTLNAPTRFSLKNGKGNCTLTDQDGGTAFVRGFDGSLIIASMTGGTLSLYVDSGADITINATCTSGTINIYGSGNVTDSSGAGCTVNDYTAFTRTKGLDNIYDDTNELQTDWANGGRLDLLLDACSTHNAGDVLDVDVSAYSGAGYAGTYIKTLYDDWLNGGRLDSILDTINDDTKLQFVAAGSKTIAASAEKYLNIDSGTDGAEIVSITIKGVVGADWTIESYVPVVDAVAAPAAGDKRDEDVYVNTDDKGGQMSNIGSIRYNMFLDITNDSAGSDDIDEVIVAYRSAGTISLAWEA